MPCKPAGTRPEPAVSVPIAMSASPVATATADPELDPPLMNSGLRLSGTAPYGERVPTRPVANWSRLVLPTTTAPADRSAATAAASRAGRYANSEQAAVVGSPAASTLSFTASRTPASGPWLPASSAATSASGLRLIHTVMATNLSGDYPQCAIHPQGPRVRRAAVAAVSAPSRSMAVSPTSPGMHRARRSR